MFTQVPLRGIPTKMLHACAVSTRLPFHFQEQANNLTPADDYGWLNPWCGSLTYGIRFVGFEVFTAVTMMSAVF
jgi:hypothetical protein